MTFKELEIIEPLLEALIKEGYETPTPIQEESIPHLLAGKDLLGCAQTGTGKTAAFALPILQKILLSPKGEKKERRDRTKLRALILAPTRELAAQIGESIAKYSSSTNLRHTVIFGGVGQKRQTDALKRGVDILVATPGRLLDLTGQGYINYSNIDFFVLDEADRMLDMGFFPDIERIVNRLPKDRQTLLFSATMPQEVSTLAESLLNDPVKITIDPSSPTVEAIDQYLYFTKKEEKVNLLLEILEDKYIENVLVFSRTKHGADRLSRTLCRAGISTDSIHGNKSQSAREKSLVNFKKRKTRVLVATDIASRGIDISQISHVINFDLPEDPETYVHRIGRTGRAGCDGTALSFCDISETSLLKSIQKFIKKEIPIVEEHNYMCQDSFIKATTGKTQRKRGSRSGRSRKKNFDQRIKKESA